MDPILQFINPCWLTRDLVASLIQANTDDHEGEDDDVEFPHRMGQSLTQEAQNLFDAEQEEAGLAGRVIILQRHFTELEARLPIGERKLHDELVLKGPTVKSLGFIIDWFGTHFSWLHVSKFQTQSPVYSWYNSLNQPGYEDQAAFFKNHLKDLGLAIRTENCLRTTGMKPEWAEPRCPR